jgi:hypothetical protein
METIKLFVALGIAIATNAHSLTLLVKEVKNIFKRSNEKKPPEQHL